MTYSVVCGGADLSSSLGCEASRRVEGGPLLSWWVRQHEKGEQGALEVVLLAQVRRRERPLPNCLLAMDGRVLWVDGWMGGGRGV